MFSLMHPALNIIQVVINEAPVMPRDEVSPKRYNYLIRRRNQSFFEKWRQLPDRAIDSNPHIMGGAV
jgi:hypothetical protein